MTWSGQWVADRLGVELFDGTDSLIPIRELTGLAVRVNPRRAHLLVSTVLGKHVPVEPRVCYAAGRLLGGLIAGFPAEHVELLRSALAGDRSAAVELLARLERHQSDFAGVVLGYAETATGLGHAVADSLRAPYLHSTRRQVGGVRPAAGFEEEHSHATGHLLLPSDRELLVAAEQIVLVDDELSTGRTVLNTIRSLLAAGARCRRFVVAALIDVRDDRVAFAAAAAELGVEIAVIALATGQVGLPPDVLDRGQALVKLALSGAKSTSGGDFAPVSRQTGWSAAVPDGARHGFDPADRPMLEAQARQCATGLPLRGSRVLVLGFEELMYAPLRIAQFLAEQHPEVDVRFSSTTRSPVLAVDDPGYAIRSSAAFPAQDEPGGQRYAYNVGDFTDVIAVIDDQAQPPELPGLTQVVVIPSHRPLPVPLRGPRFGSYRPEEVSWLLTDLSDVELEAPTEEREEAIQLGQAHYAESLPIEFTPDAAYQSLFAQSLRESAATVAEAVATVTELVLTERGPDVALASLARAGTPIGVLMRRWARYAHGLELPHYTLSIVRGRGIDLLALRYLARHHDPADVVFVDGWTGKGAIAVELAQALEQAEEIGPFSAELAVLADTGSCVRTFGTRADFLIPSACLNSTVSGLVSRTVLNDQLIGPGQFHGAKFYRELAGQDVSNAFLDAITAEFPNVAPKAPGDREPTWAGWQAVEKISREYGIGNINLVKPGVGETTRVLLRRVPWRILVRPDALPALGHILLLAEQRGVPIELVEGLAYSCVGLIHPGFTRSEQPEPERSTA